MPGPYNDDPTIQGALADLIQKAGGAAELSAANQRQAATGRDWAYHWILDTLVSRGYTTAQIDTWVSRKDYERAIGLWWALVQGEFDTDVDTAVMKELDWRNQLLTATALVAENGTLIVPSTPGATGAVGHGTVAAAVPDPGRCLAP